MTLTITEVQFFYTCGPRAGQAATVRLGDQVDLLWNGYSGVQQHESGWATVVGFGRSRIIAKPPNSTQPCKARIDQVRNVRPDPRKMP